MAKENLSKRNQYLINTDIMAIFRLSSIIQWDELRQNSIYRILYLATVLYSFRHPEKENPFNIYRFAIDTSLPYDSNIATSIDYLLKDDFLQRAKGDDILILGKSANDELFKVDIAKERYEWLKQVMYILGLYGEDKIYDFIFRDPQYQTTIKSNTQQSIPIIPNNETVKTLKSFQKAFEDTLKDVSKITKEEYLELYFEYVFSKVIKRKGL